LKEKNEKSRLGKCLSVALCLAAVLGGAWACLLYTVLSQRGNALPAGVPAQEEAPVAAPGEAEPAALPESEESAVSSEPETFPEPIAFLEPAPAAPWLLSLAQVAEAVGRSYHEVDRLNKRGLMPPPVYLPSGRGTGERKSPSFLADEIRDWLLAGCPHRKAWEEMKKNRAPQPL